MPTVPNWLGREHWIFWLQANILEMQGSISQSTPPDVLVHLPKPNWPWQPPAMDAMFEIDLGTGVATQ